VQVLHTLSILKQQKEVRNSTYQAQKSPQLWKSIDCGRSITETKRGVEVS
jgi:hypothetical protein